MMLFYRITAGSLVLLAAAGIWGYALFSGRADLARGGTLLMQATADLAQPLCEPSDWLPTGDVTAVQQAHAWFSQALRNDDKLAEAYLLRGQAACLLGDYMAAVTDLGMFTRLQPDNPLGWVELGFALDASGSVEGAAVVWRRAGLNAEAFLQVAEAAREQQDWSRALRYYHWVQAMGMPVQGMVALCRFELLRETDWDTAIEVLQSAVEADAGWVNAEARFWARLRLGEGWLQRGVYLNAQQALLLAVAAGEQGQVKQRWLGEAYRLLAAVAHAQQNLDQANIWIAQALVLNPDSAWAYVERGKLIYRCTGMALEAQKDFLHGLNLSNYSPVMSKNLLVFWQQEQQSDALLELCNVLEEHHAVAAELQGFCGN